MSQTDSIWTSLRNGGMGALNGAFSGAQRMWNGRTNQEGTGRWAWWGSLAGAGFFAWSALSSGAGIMEVLLYAAIGALVGALVGGALSGAVEGFSQNAPAGGNARRRDEPERGQARGRDVATPQPQPTLIPPRPGEEILRNGEFGPAPVTPPVPQAQGQGVPAPQR